MASSAVESRSTGEPTSSAISLSFFVRSPSSRVLPLMPSITPIAQWLQEDRDRVPTLLRQR